MSKLTPSLLEKLQQISEKAKTIQIDPNETKSKKIIDDNSDEDFEEIYGRKRKFQDENKQEMKRNETNQNVQSNKNEEYLKIVIKSINNHYEKDMKIIHNTREISIENEDENNTILSEIITKEESEYFMLILNDTYSCCGFHLKMIENKWNISYCYNCKLEFFSYNHSFVENEDWLDCDRNSIYKKCLDLKIEKKFDFIPTQVVLLN